jgi:hypothetical protein
MQPILFGALAGVVGAALTTFVALRSLQRTHLLAYRSEDLVRRLLQHPKWRLRTFKTLKFHIAGFADDDLRQTLIRAGAVRFADADGVEVWGLIERVADLLDAEVGTRDN